MRDKLRKLLFKLHIVNIYPTTWHGFPANIIRTDGKSYDIKPDVQHLINDVENLRVDAARHGFYSTGTDPSKTNHLEINRGR